MCDSSGEEKDIMDHKKIAKETSKNNIKLSQSSSPASHAKIFSTFVLDAASYITALDKSGNSVTKGSQLIHKKLIMIKILFFIMFTKL